MESAVKTVDCTYHSPHDVPLNSRTDLPFSHADDHAPCCYTQEWANVQLAILTYIWNAVNSNVTPLVAPDSDFQRIMEGTRS